MKAVNTESKAILDQLSELMEDDYLKLNKNDVYMSLIVERIEKTVISLCHYGEQNGDLMRDPEMLFWRDDNGNYFPFYFRNDYVGVEETIGAVINNVLSVFDESVQKDQTEFADIWMKNIKYQQQL